MTKGTCIILHSVIIDKGIRHKRDYLWTHLFLMDSTFTYTSQISRIITLKACLSSDVLGSNCRGNVYVVAISRNIPHFKTTKNWSNCGLSKAKWWVPPGLWLMEMLLCYVEYRYHQVRWGKSVSGISCCGTRKNSVLSHLYCTKLSCPPRWAWQEFWPWCHPGELDPWWAAAAEWAAAPGTLQQRMVWAAGRGCGEEASGSAVRWLQSTPAAGWSSAGLPGPSLSQRESSAPEQERPWLPGSESQFEPESEEK